MPVKIILVLTDPDEHETEVVVFAGSLKPGYRLPDLNRNPTKVIIPML
jgi:hypothetical protein